MRFDVLGQIVHLFFFFLLFFFLQVFLFFFQAESILSFTSIWSAVTTERKHFLNFFSPPAPFWRS